ncbi:nucleotidyltransferase domain-containing protein [Pseudonocardia sp. NPDC049635]|uniref:nucleotidyltransferase domain-containing protein n=1 Tax=Pseudonocardia sp. NPDC049635 TaxID=3155506 RepID=UPI0033DA952B
MVKTGLVSGTEQETRDAAVAALRSAGARFALVHGSRAPGGSPRPGSDLDVAAWWAADPPAPFEVDLPAGVDLLVLNDAPLELAGRVALHGRLLFDDDPPARVRWVATTRKIYSDELPRITRAHREFLDAMRSRDGR